MSEQPEEVLRGEMEIATHLGMSTRNVTYLARRRIDPVPVRIAPGGLWALRAKLDLWMLREPSYGKAPILTLPIAWGIEEIGVAVHLTRSSVYRYRRETAPFERLPIWTYKGREWAYVAALEDWLDSQSMSVQLHSAMLKFKKGEKPEEGAGDVAE